MATKEEFQEMARESITGEYGDFNASLSIVNAGSYDPINGQSGGESQTIDCIRIDYSDSQVDNVNIMRGDFKIILLNQDLTIDISTSSTTASIESKAVDIVYTSVDPADAVMTIQARVK